MVYIEDTSSPRRLLKAGINVPIVTFFDEETEDLDLETTTKHVLHLVAAGVSSITVQGSNGEAVHLTREERMSVTKATREVLDRSGFESIPVIVGCTAQSVRETILLCKDACRAGGDFALLLPPCYYKSMYSREDIRNYFRQVADASPLPVVIYNYPSAVAGVDLDSDDLIALAEHPNIVGCKLTCGNVGKLCRITSAVRCATAASPSKGWICMGGMADFTLQTLSVGGSGTVTGLGNLTPRACVEVFRLYAQGKVDQAREVQALVAQGDWAVITGGVPATKAILQHYYGYGGRPRQPLSHLEDVHARRYIEMIKPLMEFEARFARK